MQIEELMNQYYNCFTSNDQYICQCILNHKKDCMKLSIDDFADKYHISSSALSRFAQKLKLPGYSELRTILRLNEKKPSTQYKSMDEIIHCYQNVINDIEHRDCSILFEKISSANRIIIFSDGYVQRQAAKEMKRIFLPTGKKFYDVYEFESVELLSEFIQEDDIIFFISLNGNSKKLIDLAQNIKMKKIFMISITKMTSNSLSHLCNENLYIPFVRFNISQNIKYEVTTPYFILIELLYVKYKIYCSAMNILP